LSIKGFALDVDRTLTDRQGLLDTDAVQVIRWLRSTGHEVVLASGRAYCITTALSIFIGTSRVVIAENGGVVGETMRRPILLAEKARAEAGLAALRERLGEQVRVREVQHSTRYTDIMLERSFDLKLGEGILMEKAIGARLVDTGVVFHILDSGASKGTALAKAAELLGLPPESFAAIGNGLNDIEMFKVARYGVALANSPERTREEADYVCVSGYSAGLREAVEWVIDQESRKV
jgi:phosphoglycolate phosphatase (TIGR01487 family)